MQSSSAASLTLKEKLTQQRLGFEYERLVAAEQRAERALKSITLSLDSENQRLKNYLATQSKNNITEDQLAKKNDIYYNGRKKAIEREETKLTAAQQALELAKTAREAFAKENPWVLDIKPKTATVTQTPLTLFDFVDPAKITTVKFLGPHSSNTSTLTRVSTPSISPSTAPSADPVDPLLNTSRGGTLSQTSATPLPASSSIHPSSSIPSSGLSSSRASSTPSPLSSAAETESNLQSNMRYRFGNTSTQIIEGLPILSRDRRNREASDFLTKVRKLPPTERLELANHLLAIAQTFDGLETQTKEKTNLQDEIRTSLDIANLVTELPSVSLDGYNSDQIDQTLQGIRQLSTSDAHKDSLEFLRHIRQLHPNARLAISAHLRAIATAYDAKASGPLHPKNTMGPAFDIVTTSVPGLRGSLEALMAAETSRQVAKKPEIVDAVDKILAISHRSKDLPIVYVYRGYNKASYALDARLQDINACTLPSELNQHRMGLLRDVRDHMSAEMRTNAAPSLIAIAQAIDERTKQLHSKQPPIEADIRKLISQGQEAAPVAPSRSMRR